VPHFRNFAAELNVHILSRQSIIPFLPMARTLVEEEQEVEVREGHTKTVDCIFELEFHMTVCPVAFMVLPISERLQER
jgi:hypothetical protein